MARPIEPTPPVEGLDAERLLESLSTGASDAEMQRRQKAAEEYVRRFETNGRVVVKLQSR